MSKYIKPVSVPDKYKEEFTRALEQMMELTGKSFADLTRQFIIEGEFLTSSDLSHWVGRETLKVDKQYIVVAL